MFDKNLYTLDYKLNLLIEPFSKLVADVVFFKIQILEIELPVVILWLIFAGIFFTCKFNFVQFMKIGSGFQSIFSAKTNNNGDITQLQALFTAISGTVGIGNLGGVAIAISIGGPGAVIWMIVGGFLGMVIKFVECSLAVIYRKNINNRIIGGPMVYLSQGLATKGWVKCGQYLGLLYAVVMIVACVGIGNMFQVNQAFAQIVYATGDGASWFADKGWFVGLILAVIVGFILIGGIKSIVKITDKIVPLMACLYVICALYVLVTNYQVLPKVLLLIWQSAFYSSSIKGGVVGVMTVGFQRAFFSNEAGVGSSAIVHSAAKTNIPVSQGFVGMIEPLIDTVIICTLTALVIIIAFLKSPDVLNHLNGIKLTSLAFSMFFNHADIVLSVIVVLFAFSTLIAWSYYGLQAWQFVFGSANYTRVIFYLLFCLCIIIGCMVSLRSVVSLADSCLFALCVPNVIGLYVLSDDVKKLLTTHARINH
jgi:AGCS family alanine or glycine:cation symporter